MINPEEEFDSAFSGSDRISSPYIRPRNPDMHNSIRLKLSAAKLFSANTSTNPISPLFDQKRSISRISSKSDDSTFIIETRSNPEPVKTYL